MVSSTGEVMGFVYVDGATSGSAGGFSTSSHSSAILMQGDTVSVEMSTGSCAWFGDTSHGRTGFQGFLVNVI